MTELRKRMIKDLQLRGMSQRTQEMQQTGQTGVTSSMKKRSKRFFVTFLTLPPSFLLFRDVCSIFYRCHFVGLRRHCPECGQVNAPHAKFCRKCGKQIQESEFVCPKCGEKIPSDSVYCQYCGRRVNNTKQVDPISLDISRQPVFSTLRCSHNISIDPLVEIRERILLKISNTLGRTSKWEQNT